MSQYPVTENYDDELNTLPPPLEPGSYVVRLIETRSFDNQGGKYLDKDGFEYELFVFDVLGRENRLFDRICLKEDHPYASLQLGRLKQMLKAMGVSTDRPGDTQDLEGKVCRVDVVRKEIPKKDGTGVKVVNNILRYYPVEGQKPSKNPDDDLPF